MADFQMTPELRERLKGVLPFSRDARDRFTPELFNGFPPEIRPVFLQRPFEKAEKREVVKVVSEGTKADPDKVTEWARLSVTGWENLSDISTGEAIEYKADANGNPEPGLFDRIPDNLVASLLLNAIRISGVGLLGRAGLG